MDIKGQHEDPCEDGNIVSRLFPCQDAVCNIAVFVSGNTHSCEDKNSFQMKIKP